MITTDVDSTAVKTTHVDTAHFDTARLDSSLAQDLVPADLGPSGNFAPADLTVLKMEGLTTYGAPLGMACYGHM